MKKIYAIVLIILFALLSFTACAKGAPSDDPVANGNFVNYGQDGKVITYTESVIAAKWVRETNVDSTKYVTKTEDLYNKAVVPVYENKQYKGMQRWADTLPDGWKIRTSDSAVASFAGYEYGEKDGVKTAAVTLIVDKQAVKSNQTAIGNGWIQLYQTVKVNPRANYQITYDYNGFINRPDSALVKDAAGMGVWFKEDPSYIPANMLGASNNQFSQNLNTATNDVKGLDSVKTYKSPVFNTGSRRSLTVCISVGAPGHAAGDARVNIMNIKMTPIDPDEIPAHTIIKNRGYKDSNVTAIVITAAAFVILLALCWFVVHGVNKNYVYSKAKEDDGTDIKSMKVTDTKAYKAKQPPKAKETDKWKKK